MSPDPTSEPHSQRNSQQQALANSTHLTWQDSVQSAEQEIQTGQRFAFGKNWASFLQTLDESRIDIAVTSLQNLIQRPSLAGLRFLDLGSGSGLFSLAARRLGAEVVSIDFDPESVACTKELRDRFEKKPASWVIHQGSALDADFLKSLGEFDIVYSWGVLHHTGDMWGGIQLAIERVNPTGTLVLALYNDQGIRSQLWRVVKQSYCSGSIGQSLIRGLFYPWFTIRTILVSLIRGRNEFRAYRRHRGMSITHDWDDWLGGLPFEVVKFESLVDWMKPRGLTLTNSKKTRRLGCHEFVFQRVTQSPPQPKEIC